MVVLHAIRDSERDTGGWLFRNGNFIIIEQPLMNKQVYRNCSLTNLRTDIRGVFLKTLHRVYYFTNCCNCFDVICLNSMKHIRIHFVYMLVETGENGYKDSVKRCH